MSETLAWPFTILAFLGVMVAITRYGFDRVIQPVCVVLLLLLPVWIRGPFGLAGIGSLAVDLRSGVGAALILGYLLQPVRLDRRFRWLFLDTLMVLYCLSQTVSVFANAGFVPFQPIEQARQFFIPYILGRLFLRDRADIQRSMPYFAACGLMVAVWGVLEAITKINPVPLLFGKSWPLLETAEGFRWGLKRAQGPTNHPIFFGLVLALMLPWMIEAGRAYQRRHGPFWWQFSAWGLAAAAIVTVSRAAQLALLGVGLSDFFFRNPKARLALVAAGCLMLVGFLTYREELIDQLSAFAGEEADLYTFPATIDGVIYPYSGTRHRDLLEIAYADAAAQAGWFGYGMEMEGKLPIDPNLDERFKSIDHQYLLELLHFGQVGVALFLLTGICGLIYLFGVAWGAGRGSVQSSLAGGLFGATLMVFLALRGVAMAEDVVVPLFFTLGIAARLHTWRIEPRRS